MYFNIPKPRTTMKLNDAWNAQVLNSWICGPFLALIRRNEVQYIPRRASKEEFSRLQQLIEVQLPRNSVLTIMSVTKEWTKFKIISSPLLSSYSSGRYRTPPIVIIVPTASIEKFNFSLVSN